MFYRYDIHIKLRIKRIFDNKLIKRCIEYFMGVGSGKVPDNYESFFTARKSISIGITKRKEV